VVVVSSRDQDLELIEAVVTRLEELSADVRLDAVVASELSIQQLKVLMLATYRSPLTAHDVADTLQVSAPTVSGLVGRLVSHGLLVQEPAPTDRRIRHLRVTAAGRAAIEEVSNLHLRQRRELLGRLTDDEVAALRIGLGGLERAFREHLAEGADGADAEPRSR
jgi:DNA-binding MarR family transcriptional regulator